MTVTERLHRPVVLLASASPRRRELLEQIGIAWRTLPGEVDETGMPGEEPADYVRRVALAKARAAWTSVQPDPGVPVLAADTAVVAGGQVLGKPADATDAARMLGLLSGRSHQVLTAVAVISRVGESVALSRSEVTFRHITPQEMAAYWRSGEPADKAGAYAIQGRGAVFVSELRGSYSGVVGLPLYETAGLLEQHGVASLCAEGRA